MADAVGFFLFLTTLCELARGSHAPSVPPVWDRHLLNARVPARVTHVHHEYDVAEPEADSNTVACNDNVQRSFFFGPSDISALRRLLHPRQRERATDFETLTSFIWRCRTAALRLHPDTKVPLKFVVNARPKLKNPPLPPGYYGNAIVTPAAISTAKELTERPLGFALGLVHEVISSVTEDYIRSVADFTANRPHPEAATLFMVSDVRRSGLEKVDFGLGKPLYGGLAEARAGDFQGLSFYITHKNKMGETGTVVLICLSAAAMEMFEKEVNSVLGIHHQHDVHSAGANTFDAQLLGEIYLQNRCNKQNQTG